MYCDSGKESSHITGGDYYFRLSARWLLKCCHYLSLYRNSEFGWRHCQRTAKQSQWCIIWCCERCEWWSGPQDKQHEWAVHGYVSEWTVQRPEGLCQWWEQLQFFPGVTFGCIKSDWLCTDTMDGADGLFVMFGILTDCVLTPWMVLMDCL